MEVNRTDQSQTYRIIVKETIDHHFADWMDNLNIIPQENGATILVGSFTD